MKITSNNKSYFFNNQKNKPEKNVSFGAIKGLGDKTDDLLEFAAKEAREIFAKNSSLSAEWDVAYRKYLDGVKNCSPENVLRNIIKELREIRVKVEMAALDAKRRSIILENRVKQREAETINDQHVVEGFGLGKIAGYDDIKDILRREFISKIKKERNGEKVEIPSAFFFFGPKGNGKTTSTLAIAEETGCDIQKLRYTPYENTEQEFCEKIINLAQTAENNFKKQGRKIFFIDEFTSFVNGDKKAKAAFFDFLKDCSTKFHCTFFGTTNFLSSAGEEVKKINPVFVSYDPPQKINMMKILKHYADGREAGEINYSELADNLTRWAKENNGTLGNSHLKNIVNGASSNTKRLTARDILDYAENKFPLKYQLLDEQTLKNYKTDYTNFIEK